MKPMRIALLIFLCLLCSLASAQSYSIRIEYNSNLRAANSLSARIVTTAQSGATLQVIGKTGRWLKISRNGREVWMAAWVSHSRVTGSAAASDVDNCCFVNRQCISDQEWVAGYWAYQNNECPVSPGAPNQTAPPAQASQPATVNNCCYIDRRCNSEQDWVNGYFAYQNQQCLMPGQFGNAHGVMVIGGKGFISQMEDALDLLRRRAPQWYNYTVSGLARIVQRLESDVPGMDVGTRTFYLDYTDHYPQGYTAWQHISNTAAMLTHEACHQHRADLGLEPGGYPGEKACLAIQIETLKAINAPRFWIDSYQDTLDNIDDPARQWWARAHY